MDVEMLWTCQPDDAQSDRIYLDSLGLVMDLRYSDAWPGGSLNLAARLLVPPDFSHRAITPGRELGISVGGLDVWGGELQEPEINDDGSRGLVGIGYAGLTKNFVALGLSTHNALNPNEVIDATRLSGRHGRFYRPVDPGTGLPVVLPFAPGSQAEDGSLMMDEALAQASVGAGKRWRVGRDKAIHFYPVTGDGTQYILRSRVDIGRTLDGVVSRVAAAYVDALTGLYNVEHWDAPREDFGGTVYPNFYTDDLTAYSVRNFTLYSDGVDTYAYAMRAPATATHMTLSSGQDLYLIETSQFLSQWKAAGSPASVGTGGRTADYYDVSGALLGTGDQDGTSYRGVGSLYATEWLSPREQMVDLTQTGSFTMDEALVQMQAALTKIKSEPHYSGSLVAAPGDLLNPGGVPVDLSTVQAGCVVDILVMDPTRNLALSADTPSVLIGEVEYDKTTGTLSMTPVQNDEPVQAERYIDPITGLYR